MERDTLYKDEVLEVTFDIAKSVNNNGLMFNERYLHHFFSSLLHDRHNLLDLTKDRTEIVLHPEWPTYKKQTGLLFGRYKRKNRKYLPDVNGAAGFVDFAIGNYYRPDIGIEFTLKFGWSHEEIIYDFLKLLDNRNPFKTSISLNFILRHLGLVSGKSLKNLEDHMNKAFKEATERLEKEITSSRELYFIVVELDKDNNRRFWSYDRITNKFERGLPVIH